MYVFKSYYHFFKPYRPLVLVCLLLLGSVLKTTLRIMILVQCTVMVLKSFKIGTVQCMLEAHRIRGHKLNLATD